MRCDEVPILKVSKQQGCRQTTPDALSQLQDEMKLNEMDEVSVEKWWNESCGWEKREKHLDKLTQTPFRPSRNTYEVTET